MARIAAGTNLSITQLERILRARRSELQRVARRRAKLARQLAKLDAQLANLGGEAGGIGGGRVRNEQSLVKMIEGVLGRSGKAMNVGDIANAVRAKGYKSNSANFRGIVNQTLIKERKKFASAGRGIYQLKK